MDCFWSIGGFNSKTTDILWRLVFRITYIVMVLQRRYRGRVRWFLLYEFLGNSISSGWYIWRTCMPLYMTFTFSSIYFYQTRNLPKFWFWFDLFVQYWHFEHKCRLCQADVPGIHLQIQVFLSEACQFCILRKLASVNKPHEECFVDSQTEGHIYGQNYL